MVVLSSILASSIPVTAAARPTVHSSWTASPPAIDGIYTAGEWANLQIVFKSPEYPESYVLPTYVYFLNDNMKLYVMVDAVGDINDHEQDVCLLWFDYKSEHPYRNVEVKVSGKKGVIVSDPFDAAVGFGSSPNSGVNHKIYEFGIPFSHIGLTPGGDIDFCSPFMKYGSIPYDGDNGKDNIWPQELGMNLPMKLDDWGILMTGISKPVGGLVVSARKLEILTPYLALAGLVAAASVAMIRRKV
ncbi:MAG: hypothetical protein QXO25_01595 [Candidatus Bathyarchaeia archaeon]